MHTEHFMTSNRSLLLAAGWSSVGGLATGAFGVCAPVGVIVVIGSV